MSLKHLVVIVLLMAGALNPARAQEPKTTLSLVTETSTLQTGQEYFVSIKLDNAPGIWSMNVEIDYDPEKLYVMGTQAGSPVSQGAFFSPPAATVVVRNEVRRSRVIYTISKLGETESARGSGVIGTFRIYPLAPGKTSLTFFDAQVTDISIETGATGESQTVTHYIPFTPVLLELTITGDPVEPPAEATATPAPTETTSFVPGATQPPQATALVNVTAAPVTTTAPATPQADNTPLLAVAIGAMVIGAVGLVAVLMLWRRSRRRG